MAIALATIWAHVNILYRVVSYRCILRGTNPKFQLQHFVVAPPSDAETKLNADAQLQIVPFGLIQSIKIVSEYERLNDDLAFTISTLQKRKRQKHRTVFVRSRGAKSQPHRHSDTGSPCHFCTSRLQNILALTCSFAARRRWKFGKCAPEVKPPPGIHWANPHILLLTNNETANKCWKMAQGICACGAFIFPNCMEFLDFRVPHPTSPTWNSLPSDSLACRNDSNDTSKLILFRQSFEPDDATSASESSDFRAL